MAVRRVLDMCTPRRPRAPSDFGGTMPSTPIPAADVAEWAALHAPVDLADVLAAADAVEARLGA